MSLVSTVRSVRKALRASLLLVHLGAIGSATALAQAPASATAPTVVTCVSLNGERKVCPAETAAGVALLRSVGASSCLLGKTWGYDAAGIWVTESCGGEFALGAPFRDELRGAACRATMPPRAGRPQGRSHRLRGPALARDSRCSRRSISRSPQSRSAWPVGRAT